MAATALSPAIREEDGDGLSLLDSVGRIGEGSGGKKRSDGMSAEALVQLTQRRVEKPWGRRDLPPQFAGGSESEAPVGEIWFEDPKGRDLPLLIKYLFTSQRLSVQVHPDDSRAAELGHRRGKDEAWLVLDAEPDATLGIGLKTPLAAEELRAAAQDGSIENLLVWRPVAAGEAYYSPAGTIHAIGAGLVLLEVQQNVDLTYRLYDYGRPRELHLDEGIRSADPAAMARRAQAGTRRGPRQVIADGPAFRMERWEGPVQVDCAGSPERPVWLVPLAGTCEAGNRALLPGTAWLVEGEARVRLPSGAEAVFACLPGAPPFREA